MNHSIETGMVVWARVFNAIEDRTSKGKKRPCIVIEREGGHYVVIRLTTNQYCHDGTRRVDLPRQEAVGLCKRTYLSDLSTRNVSVLDVDEPSQPRWITTEMADVVCRNTRMLRRQAAALQAAASAHGVPFDLAA